MLRKKCDVNIARTIELAREMIRLARTGDEDREDPGCGVLYGILLDSGYRILDLAQKEKQAHMDKGWWNNSTQKQSPVIDLNCCILCEICVDLAPHAFQINDAGYVEVLALNDYSDQDIHEAIKNCPKDCITWEHPPGL